MKSAGKARSNGLYRHIRTSKEIIRNLLNDYQKLMNRNAAFFGCIPNRHTVCQRRPRRRAAFRRHGGHGAKAQGQGGAEDCGK